MLKLLAIGETSLRAKLAQRGGTGKKKFSEKWNHYPDHLLNFLVKLKPFPLLYLSVMNAYKSSVGEGNGTPLQYF